jgi:hypothetical protein
MSLIYAEKSFPPLEAVVVALMFGRARLQLRSGLTVLNEW